MAGIAWLGPAPLVLVLSVLLGGRWSRPTLAVPGAVLLVGAVAAWLTVWQRNVHAARRWTADPPGPPREAPPLRGGERWLIGRRGVVVLGLVMAGSVLAMVGVLLAAAVG